MDVVNLPILPATALLKDAVRAMRIQQRSAVLREQAKKLELIRITKIFNALGHQLSELSQVHISEPVYRPTRMEISLRHLDTKAPHNTWGNWQSLVTSVRHDYVLIDSSFGSALILTLHEGLAGEIRTSPADCYCLGPDEHSLPPATIVPKNNCSICSYTVHCE